MAISWSSRLSREHPILFCSTVIAIITLRSNRYVYFNCVPLTRTFRNACFLCDYNDVAHLMGTFREASVSAKNNAFLKYGSVERPSTIVNLRQCTACKPSIWWWWFRLSSNWMNEALPRRGAIFVRCTRSSYAHDSWILAHIGICLLSLINLIILVSRWQLSIILCAFSCLWSIANCSYEYYKFDAKEVRIDSLHLSQSSLIHSAKDMKWL